jgi:hypothetical protein
LYHLKGILEEYDSSPGNISKKSYTNCESWSSHFINYEVRVYVTPGTGLIHQKGSVLGFHVPSILGSTFFPLVIKSLYISNFFTHPKTAHFRVMFSSWFSLVRSLLIFRPTSMPTCSNFASLYYPENGALCSSLTARNVYQSQMTVSFNRNTVCGREGGKLTGNHTRKSSVTYVLLLIESTTSHSFHTSYFSTV